MCAWIRQLCQASLLMIRVGLVLWLATGAGAAVADAPINLLESFAGNVNYTGTQRTLRKQPNTGDPCDVISPGDTTTATLSGIPAGATIKKAYLYWAGSGSPDFDVTFEGSAITADRQYTSASTGSDYFSGVADVTARVSTKRNGTYSFSGLTVNTDWEYCSVEGVLGGWVLLVIYSDPVETFRVLNIYEGFQPYQYSSITLDVSNFQIPNPIGSATGRHGHITWEGDPTLSGGGENLTFNGYGLTDGINPTGNQFNSASNINGSTNSYGVDFDVYNLSSPVIQAGQTTARTIYSSGQDLVLLSAEIIAVPNIPVADLSIDLSLGTSLVRGQNAVYSITVTNNGPNSEPGTSAQPITVTDTLPAELTFVSGSGTGWSCTASGQVVTCTYSGGTLASDASAPALALTVAVSAAASGTIINTATVDGTRFDNVSGNDTATDSYTFLPTAYAYYAMDEATWSGGTVPDSSGNGNNGTVLGTAAPTGYPPSGITSAIPGSPGTCGAASIPGDTSSGVNTGIDLNNVGNAGTIAFWYNSNANWNDGTDRMLLDATRNVSGGGNNDKHFYLVKRSGGSLMFALEDSLDTNSTATSGAFTGAAYVTNTWHHIAVAWNLGADRIQIYLDGALVATSTTNVNGTLGNVDTLYLGARRGNAGGTPGNYTPNSANGYIDEVYVFSGALSAAEVSQLKENTHPCSGAVSHYEITYPLGNPGLTCEALAVRVTAHNASHNVVVPPAATQITLSTTPSAEAWALKSGVGVFTPPNKYTFSGTENYAEFWLTQTTPTAAPHIDIDVSDGSRTDLDGDAVEDAKAQFADTGFIVSDQTGVPVTINNQIADKNANAAPDAQNLYLRAVRKSDNSKACVSALQGVTAVEWAYECINPASCDGTNWLNLAAAETKTIARNNAAGVSSYTSVNMQFDANGYSPFTFLYKDVGRIRLHARKALNSGLGTPPSTAAILLHSSNEFVVKPHHFDLSDIKRTADAFANPGAADASGGVFIAAGEAFSLTVKAMSQLNQPTPSFGKESPAQGVSLLRTLVAPAGGNNPALSNSMISGSQFAGGVATLNNLAWPEVGIIKLDAIANNAGANDYLGAGAVSGATTGTTGNVGRFIPHHFLASNPVALGTRSDLACVPASPFTYMGETMRLTQVITAQNSSNGTTQNYEGAFAKLDGANAANWIAMGDGKFGLGAIDGTTTPLSSRLSISGIPAGTWTAGEATFTAQVVLGRATSPDGPFNSLRLGIAPKDTDGVALLAGALNLDADLAGGVERQEVATTRVLYGRVRMNNAHGSERLPLPVPVKREFFISGTGFVTNGDDTCTGFALTPTTNNAPTSYTYGDVLINNALLNMTVGASVPTIANNPLAPGESILRLSAPGVGRNGSVDVQLSVPDYLQFPWSGGVNRNPTARATFGIYKGNNQFIYMRENY